MKYLRTFGEMAVVAISEGRKLRSKLDRRGRTSIFVGYACRRCVKIFKCTNQESCFELRCTMAEFVLETLRNET